MDDLIIKILYTMIAWFRYICLIVSLIITMPELLSAQRLVSQRQEDVEEKRFHKRDLEIKGWHFKEWVCPNCKHINYTYDEED